MIWKLAGAIEDLKYQIERTHDSSEVSLKIEDAKIIMEFFERLFGKI